MMERAAAFKAQRNRSHQRSAMRGGVARRSSSCCCWFVCRAPPGPPPPPLLPDDNLPPGAQGTGQDRREASQHRQAPAGRRQEGPSIFLPCHRWCVLAAAAARAGRRKTPRSSGGRSRRRGGATSRHGYLRKEECLLLLVRTRQTSLRCKRKDRRCCAGSLLLQLRWPLKNRGACVQLSAACHCPPLLLHFRR